MWWYVAKRLLQTIPVFLGATLIIYALVFLRPGDPINGLIGNKPVSDEVRQAIRDQYHMNDFFLVQWLYFLKDVVTFNPDFVGLDGQPVFEKIRNALPVTATLALMALLMDAIIGIVVGTIAGLRRNGWFDSITLVISLILLSIPIFVVGFVLQFLFGVKFAIFSATVGGDWTVGKLLLPAFVLAIANIATTTRLTRTSVANNMTADHVRTARAKGLPEGAVIRNHVLRNSLVPVVTYIGINLGSLMAGAIITEGIFNVQGIGNLAFQAVNRGDAPVTVAVVAVMVMIYVFMSLIVDLLYAVLDPRIRYV
ncbi:ABC transporter permease subunit [Aeromicrobium sp. SMF47]|uniref:ABC transporter permease subunit n=1 Tax=Aeromicrobium yanjiei TaxID=2662028 RepID=A0A5Q2MFZ2_9ACTN|nr:MULTISPECIES: ABC transporter permease [Aeromicrobium]MRJ76788.1 ABC transporter permease subunit [Aeromicrobium yanjiei]MRK01132.1 ABC transporter permease subunit [Aeromicrobium sp. S22]QGG42077.1 ABC transporter permease subunit [Aeromicrobium yanjiei]